MAEVIVAEEARKQILKLPLPIQARVQLLVERLTRWPDISGAKPLRRDLKGAFRLRTGDWRLLFTADESSGKVTIFRVDNRRDVYE